MSARSLRASRWWHFLASLVMTVMMAAPVGESLTEALYDAMGTTPHHNVPVVIQEAFWGWLYGIRAAIVVVIDMCMRDMWDWC